MSFMRKGLIPIFLVVVGIVVGVMIATEFRLPPFGQATDAPTKSATLEPLAALSGPPASEVFVEISDRITPAVVNISTTRVIRRGEEGSPSTPFFDDPFFRRFFGDEFFRRPMVPKERREQSLGSGVIVNPNGYIVTNNHVIAKADEIKVTLTDRREFKGKVVGADPKSDIGVIKIDAENLPTIPWGDSTDLRVGEYVLAIGNPFGLSQTVTMGIISAVGRANVGITDYEDFIQTDAAINPGNSGGALVNIRGELIGINTAIFTRSGGYMGIGFAVPSSMARKVMESLIETGKVVRGWLGVLIQEVTSSLAKEFGLKEPRGALVADVLPKSPAENAGLQRGDIILEADDTRIDNTGQLRNRVAAKNVGDKITLTVFRRGKEIKFTAKIEEQPKDVAEAGPTGETEDVPSALNDIQVRDLSPAIAEELGLPPDQKGVLIDRVEPGSAPDLGGLQRGDVILEVNRRPVRNTDAYFEVIRTIKKGESILLLVNRRGRTIFIALGED